MCCCIPLCSFLSGDPTASECGAAWPTFCSLHLPCRFDFPSAFECNKPLCWSPQDLAIKGFLNSTLVLQLEEGYVCEGVHTLVCTCLCVCVSVCISLLLVCWACCNKVPQIWWLKLQKFIVSMVLETSSLETRFFVRALGKAHSKLSSFSSLLIIFPLGLSLCLNLLFLEGNQACDIRADYPNDPRLPL